MVMTLALLVYSVAQRRMRQYLQEQNEYLPTQINKPSQKVTLRWLFQLLEGINEVHIYLDGKMKRCIQGLNDLKCRILRCFGPPVMAIYGIEEENVVCLTT